MLVAEELPQPILHRCSHRLSRAETLKKKKEKERGETQNTPGRAGQSVEERKKSEGQRNVSRCNMGISLWSWPSPLSSVLLLSAVQWRAERKVKACRERLLYIHIHCEREWKEMLCPHMICSFPPPWHGCPGNQRKGGGGWGETQPIGSFRFI